MVSPAYPDLTFSDDESDFLNFSKSKIKHHYCHPFSQELQDSIGDCRADSVKKCPAMWRAYPAGVSRLYSGCQKNVPIAGVFLRQHLCRHPFIGILI